GRDGELEAIVHLARVPERLHPRARIALTVETNLGSGIGGADHLGWPVAPSRIQDVREWVATRATKSLLVLRNLDPVTGSPLVPPGARLISRSPCPRLPIPPPHEDVGGSPKFRKQI